MNHKKRAFGLIRAVVLAAGMLFPVLVLGSCQKDQTNLFIHCAAGMRTPVDAVVSLYKEEMKKEGKEVEVVLTYDGSNRLLGQLSLTRLGDIYIAGDADYIKMADEKGLAGEQGRLCYFVPVILVEKGNPKNIRTLEDLTREGISLGMGDPKAAAVGRLTNKILKKNNIDTDAWNRNLVHSTPTVNELALMVKLGNLDAAIVWDSIALNYPDDCEAITIPEEQNLIPEVGICTLTFSEQGDEAEKLMEFFTGPLGQRVLKDHGYTTQLK